LVTSGDPSVVWFQHSAKRTPVFLDAPAVMTGPTEISVDVERIPATLSDDRRLADGLLDHTNLSGFWRLGNGES
jgi:hypothetical protein